MDTRVISTPLSLFSLTPYSLANLWKPSPALNRYLLAEQPSCRAGGRRGCKPVRRLVSLFYLAQVKPQPALDVDTLHGALCHRRVLSNATVLRGNHSCLLLHSPTSPGQRRAARMAACRRCQCQGQAPAPGHKLLLR